MVLYSFRVCLRCGEILFPLTTAKVDKCSTCDFNMTEIEYTGRYLNSNQANTDDVEKQSKHITENTIKTSPYFNQEMYDKREEEEHDFRNSYNAPEQPKCPYCGSTNIQLIRRKWSLAVGLFTGKMDRYCVNCKKKID